MRFSFSTLVAWGALVATNAELFPAAANAAVCVDCLTNCPNVLGCLWCWADNKCYEHAQGNCDPGHCATSYYPTHCKCHTIASDYSCSNVACFEPTPAPTPPGTLYYCNWDTGAPVCTADAATGWGPLKDCLKVCHARINAEAVAQA